MTQPKDGPAPDELEDEEFEDEEEGHEGRKRLEGMLRDTLRKAIEKGLEAGVGTFNRADSALRGVADVKLPREVVTYVFSQVDETKNSLVRAVAREVRNILEATDLSTELQKALTTLSFEVKTEIRFIPNDSGDGIRPDVKARIMPRRRKKKAKRKADLEPSESEQDEE
jgi:hypothetical protein